MPDGEDAIARLAAENQRLRDAILDIDAHATALGEDEAGFVTGGYIVTVGSLHRALGVVGHTAVLCRYCDPGAHDCGTVARLRDGLERIVASGAYPEAAIAQELLDG